MNHIKALMAFTEPKKLTLTLNTHTPCKAVGNYHPALTYSVFDTLPRAFCCSRSPFSEFEKFLPPMEQCRCIQQGHFLPGQAKQLFLKVNLRPTTALLTLPYSQVSRRNWKKACPGIREIRAGHCLQPSRGPSQHERVTHFFKILPQLLVFCFSSPPYTSTLQTSSLDFSTQQPDTPGSLLHPGQQCSPTCTCLAQGLWRSSCFTRACKAGNSQSGLKFIALHFLR